MSEEYIEDLLSEAAIQQSLQAAGIEITFPAEGRQRLLETGSRYELWRALQRVAFDDTDYEKVLRRLAKAGLAVVLHQWPGEPAPTQLSLVFELPAARQRRLACREPVKKSGGQRNDACRWLRKKVVQRQKTESDSNHHKRSRDTRDAR